MIIPGRPLSISVAAATATLLALSNPNRVSLAIVNSGANVCSLGLGMVPGPGEGIYLNSLGGSYLIDRANPFFGEIYVYSTGGTTIAMQETSNG